MQSGVGAWEREPAPQLRTVRRVGRENGDQTWPMGPQNKGEAQVENARAAARQDAQVRTERSDIRLTRDLS
jgi:hypothetical protein